MSTPGFDMIIFLYMYVLYIFNDKPAKIPWIYTNTNTFDTFA